MRYEGQVIGKSNGGNESIQGAYRLSNKLSANESALLRRDIIEIERHEVR